MAALFNLVKNFTELFDDGYCEEDILDAFIAGMEQLRIEENDPFRIEYLEKRIKDLEEISKKWVQQNTDLSDDDFAGF